jgi:hypothetical protein
VPILSNRIGHIYHCNINKLLASDVSPPFDEISCSQLRLITPYNKLPANCSTMVPSDKTVGLVILGGVLSIAIYYSLWIFLLVSGLLHPSAYCHYSLKVCHVHEYLAFCRRPNPFTSSMFSFTRNGCCHSLYCLRHGGPFGHLVHWCRAFKRRNQQETYVKTVHNISLLVMVQTGLENNISLINFWNIKLATTSVLRFSSYLVVHDLDENLDSSAPNRLQVRSPICSTASQLLWRLLHQMHF